VAASSLGRTARLLLSARLLRPSALAYFALMALVWAALLALWLGGSGGRDSGGVVLGPDFVAFYTGGLLARQADYDTMSDLDRQQALQTPFVPGHALSAYVNPPHYAFVAAPFSTLPYAWAFALWTALMAAAFGGSIWLLRRQVFAERGGTGLLPALALLSAPVYYALSAGQNTGLSLLLHTGVLVALMRRRDGLAGALLVLGMYKPQLFVGLLPLLLLDRRWRALAVFGAGALLLGLGTLLVFGVAALQSWAALLGSPVYQAEELRQAAKMFSWQPVWQLLLGPTPAAKALGWACTLVVFGALCWLWRRKTADEPLRYAVTLCGLIVMGPHLPVYDLGLLVLPGLILAERVLRAEPSRWVGLRLALLATFVLLLFAASVELRPSMLLVPLITLVAWLGGRLLLGDQALAVAEPSLAPLASA
jgi:hypothetical protein